MQRFRKLPLLPILVSLIAGLLLGRFILGWWFPVNLTRTGPRNLEQSDRIAHLDNYVRGLLPYASTGNTAELGRALCYPVDDFDAVNGRATALKELITNEPAQQGLVGETLNQYNTVLDALSRGGGCETVRADIVGEPENVGLLGGLGVPWRTCLLGLIVLALLMGLLWFLAGSQAGSSQRRSTSEDGNDDKVERGGRRRTIGGGRSRRMPETPAAAVQEPSLEQTRYAPPVIEPAPVVETTTYQQSPPPEPESFSSAEAGFVATYTRGNESFERVFEIYGTDNNYLGDCSVQIADTVGNDRGNVTAFEIRLFEVGNPRSVTKLVMSEHAYNDSALRARLATQGTPVLAERHQPIMLQGNLITIETDITELIYAAIVTEPENSVFDRFSVKLKAFVNRPSSSSDRASDWLDS